MSILLHKPYLVKWSTKWGGGKMSKNTSTWFMDAQIFLKSRENTKIWFMVWGGECLSKIVQNLSTWSMVNPISWNFSIGCFYFCEINAKKLTKINFLKTCDFLGKSVSVGNSWRSQTHISICINNFNVKSTDSLRHLSFKIL